MHILQVTVYSDRKFGGPTQKIHALSRGLSARGHTVEVATFKASRDGTSPYHESDGVAVRNLPWVGRGLWQVPLAPRRLEEAIRRADVVHCYGLYDLLVPAAASVARRIGRPYVLEPLGMYVPRARHHRVKAIYHRLFTRWMLRHAARVVATSPLEARELAGVVSDDQLVLRRNGLDLDAYRQLPDPAPLRQRWGISAGERIVLYVGRISPVKNLEEMVRGFHQAELAEARLVLVGPSLEPDYHERLSRLIGDLGVNDRVLLPGALYDEDRLAALAAADLVVLPSVYESYGNAAAEAAAAGVPVLLSDGCGIAPLIHRKAGLAVPPTAGALSSGLRALLDDSIQRASLMERRHEVLRELSWQEPLDQSEAMYSSILERCPRVDAGATPSA